MLFFLVWVFFVAWATMLGANKYRALLGFILGFLFGIIGVLVIYLIPPKNLTWNHVQEIDRYYRAGWNRQQLSDYFHVPLDQIESLVGDRNENPTNPKRQP